MQAFLKSMFSEKGDISNMRVITTLLAVTACSISIIAVIKYGISDLNGVTALVGMILSIGVGGKAFQKVTELKNVPPAAEKENKSDK